jgi:hypothetical protein
MKKAHLQLRLGEPEKLGFKQAAKLAGLPLSGWSRSRLRAAASQELKQAGKKVSFLDSEK